MAVNPKEHKGEIIKQFARRENDTGSAEVQIALFTARINHLTEHFQSHPKDFSGRRGLLRLVGKRRKMLNYLRGMDLERYRQVVKMLGLRK